MTFDVALIVSRLPEILSGLWLTLVVWLVGTIGAVILGFLWSLARYFAPLPVQWLLRILVDLFRGTPFLIQLFLLYFGGPFIGLSLDPVPAGLLGLTLYGAAYFSEIFRAGFAAVPRGHVEAAECLGLTRAQIVRRIQIPEMTMLVLPAAVNLAIILIKETAIMSIITVPELTMVVSAIGSEFYAFVEAMFLLAVCYWVLVEISGALGRYAEAKLQKFRFTSA